MKDRWCVLALRQHAIHEDLLQHRDRHLRQLFVWDLLTVPMRIQIRRLLG